MRPSEAFALRPENIDIDRLRIHVHWQLDERGNFQELKNRRKREIVMGPEIVVALAPLLAQIVGNDLLFRTVYGKKLNCKSKWSYYWDPIRKYVGLNGMDVYELRHYCATILLDNDATPERSRCSSDTATMASSYASSTGIRTRSCNSRALSTRCATARSSSSAA